MIVVFRTDANQNIGGGHLMRCLALAQAMKKRGATPYFLMRDPPSNYQNLFKTADIAMLPLMTNHHHSGPPDDLYKHSSWLTVSMKQDAEQSFDTLKSHAINPDLIVIDHYGIGEEWENIAYKRCAKILVIDDLADRAHLCDFLIDQNYRPNADALYKNFISKKTECFFGPAYALLREEYQEIVQSPVIRHDTSPDNMDLLISYGAADPTNETHKALEAIKNSKFNDNKIDVVIGAINPNRDMLAEYISQKFPRAALHVQSTQLHELMQECDLMLGAGGSTSWERCATGLPGLITSIADNQIDICKNLAKTGAIEYFGSHQDVSVEDIAARLDHYYHHPEWLAAMSDKAQQLIRPHKLQLMLDRIM